MPKKNMQQFEESLIRLEAALAESDDDRIHTNDHGDDLPIITRYLMYADTNPVMKDRIRYVLKRVKGVPF